MRVVGAGRQRAAASLRLPALVVRHPQRFPLRGLPAVWWSWEPRSAVLSIDTQESSKLSNRGASLNRAVKETPGVKGENGEFEWLREANALNLHG